MEINFHQRALSTNPTLLKQINCARLLDLLRCRAPISRAELARYTGLTRSTVTLITAELIAEGLVREGGGLSATVGAGRPGVGLCLNPQGAFFLGATIEVEQITVVELNLAAQILQRVQQPIREGKSPETVLNQLVQLIKQVRATNPNQQRLRGIGLTIQGTLSLDGVVICSPYLNWYEVDLRRYLEPYIDVPLFVDNDANAAALAEVYLGSAIQSSSLLYVLINRGIGAGMLIHNRVWRGAYGTAGEVGALVLNPPGLSHTNNSQQKDFNELVGRKALLERYRERGGTSDLNTLIRDLTQTVPLAQEVVQEWSQVLGWGLLALVNIFNPEQVVLGGPLTVLMPYVKDHLDAMLRDYVPGNGIRGFFSNPKARFEISTFGEDAAAVGGAVLVYQSLFQVPDLVLLKR